MTLCSRTVILLGAHLGTWYEGADGAGETLIEVRIKNYEEGDLGLWFFHGWEVTNISAKRVVLLRLPHG
jgi:hypothetical protein